MEFYELIVVPFLIGSLTVVAFLSIIALACMVALFIRDLFRDFKDKKSK